jgi:hypothetical protein
MDHRLQLLTRWVSQFPGFANTAVAPVAGDASFRRYFRVWRSADWQELRGLEKASGAQADQALIVMDAPPEHEDCQPFVTLAQHWRSQGVKVPAIVQQDLAQGFLLMEDFGDRLLLGQLNAANTDRLYRSALAELLRIQQLPDNPGYPLAVYSNDLLDREMALFCDWLLQRQLGLKLNNSDLAMLSSTFTLLRESAGEQPKVPVHRDYHSRNLLVTGIDDRPGVIDFQDAVMGPITYDLVSLLKDCYVQWPHERIQTWLESYRQSSLNAGLHSADAATFRQWFELMGMQRHLKAAGIFARLALRDGKPNYLNDIPRTLGYLCSASGRQPALRLFHDWLLNTVVPAVEATLGPVPGANQP